MNENGSQPIDRSIGVVGLGYVGLPLVVSFAEAGRVVVGVDLDQRKVDALAAGESYIEDVSSERLGAVGGLVTVTSRFARLARVGAIVICVPTPLSVNREPDMGPLVAAARGVRDVLQLGQLVVLESTTYPGTTRERLVPILEESGLRAGTDFHVAFSPERVDPGRTDFTMRSTPKVVGGLTQACGDAAQALYGEICDEVVRVSSPDAAELTKLLENIFRSVNIALVNELAILAERLGIDVWEVIDAAATKPYGFMRFEPGPGMGGHCLPVDPFYLTWKAREVDFATEFIELAGKINQQMPYWCLERIERALNDAGRPVKGTRILILGVSYKAGVGDVRESPALKIMDRLAEYGAELSYHDPYVAELPEHGLRAEPDLHAALDAAELVVLVTAHPDIDLAQVVERSALLVDLRGATRKLRGLGDGRALDRERPHDGRLSADSTAIADLDEAAGQTLDEI